MNVAERDGPRETSARGWGPETAALLAIVVGVAALFGTSGMSNLGSVFPTTAAVVMILAALAVLARGVLRRRRATATTQGGAAPLPSGAIPRLLGASVVLIAWALALKPLGFLVSGALGIVLFGLLALRERMSARAVAGHVAAGVLILGSFYLLMVEVLRLSVP